jgi:hypothetical protein
VSPSAPPQQKLADAEFVERAAFAEERREVLPERVLAEYGVGVDARVGEIAGCGGS